MPDILGIYLVKNLCEICQPYKCFLNPGVQKGGVKFGGYMAKLSISQIFEKRKRIRTLTILATILLIIFLGGLITSKNPRGTKASMTWDPINKICTYTADGTSSSWSISEVGVCNNANEVIINGGTMTFSGSLHFGKLTIQNGATVTHDALTESEATNCDIDGDGSITDENVASNNGVDCTAARNKKVDLEIDEDLTLASSGSINVDGKGYPGGGATRIGDGCPAGQTLIGNVSNGWAIIHNGYGPGGGTAIYHCQTHGDDTVAGGGGYGGSGAAGRTGHGEAIPASATYPNPYLKDYSDAEFEFGSGGGGAANHDSGYSAHASGIAGGGRIKITAKNVIFSDNTVNIFAKAANGVWPVNYMADDSEKALYAYGGGGSGGTIWILAKDIDYQGQPNSYTAVQADGTTVNGGADGSFDHLLFNNNALYNFFANGSRPGTQNWNQVSGGGGGGRIIVQKIVDQNITIEKRLFPFDRGADDRMIPGAGYCDIGLPGSTNWNSTTDKPNDTTNCDYNFNPYALQVDDYIIVREKISNLTEGVMTVTDDVLQIPNTNIRCEPELVPVPPLIVAAHPLINLSAVMFTTNYNFPEITISGTIPANTTEVEWEYTCKVISP